MPDPNNNDDNIEFGLRILAEPGVKVHGPKFDAKEGKLQGRLSVAEK